MDTITDCLNQKWRESSLARERKMKPKTEKEENKSFIRAVDGVEVDERGTM
jgi:hypothetical protein